jgi:hypothetical protein
LALAVGAGLRAWLSFRDDGIYWPDEIYQSLEPAHRLVFGQGLLPHEFINGLRSWAFPGVVAALLKLTALAGGDDPTVYLTASRLVFSAVGVATAGGSYLLARALGASTIASAAGASVMALVAPAVFFAPRALSETASALPLVVGLALVLRPTAGRRDRIIGASLIGLAVLLRVQNGLVAAALLAVLAVRSSRRPLVDVGAVLGAWGLIYGLIDLLTWGRPFQSAVAYIAFNLQQPTLTGTFGDVTITQSQSLYFPPIDYYIRSLSNAMGIALVVGAGLAALGARRAWPLALVIGVFFVVHSLVPHKELRYVFAVIPLLGSLAAVGIDQVARSVRTTEWVRPALAATLVAAATVSAISFHALTLRDVGVLGNIVAFDATGQAHTLRTPDSSAYDMFGDVNRLLLVARKQSDLCGIKVESVPAAFQGGYTYLHRSVPLYGLGGPPRSSPYFNYVIALRGTDAPAELRASDGDMVLVRLRDACVPDPMFNPRL